MTIYKGDVGVEPGTSTNNIVARAGFEPGYRIEFQLSTLNNGPSKSLAPHACVLCVLLSECLVGPVINRFLVKVAYYATSSARFFPKYAQNCATFS